MRCSVFAASLFLYCALLSNVCAEAMLDRTIEKLAAEMVRERPEIKGELRSSQMREKLVEEFKDLGAGTISTSLHKQIKREKVDYDSYACKRKTAQFEKAKLTDPKCTFLLEKVKERKMRGEEYYVVDRLMQSYFEREIEKREDQSKEKLSKVGKAFTYYKRENDSDPINLSAFVLSEEDRICIDPLTNERKEWIYVGAGPSEIRGSNQYRMVAYSPFPSGKTGEYRWIVYKGGVVGEWKEKTLLAAIEKMEKENTALVKEVREVTQKPTEIKPKPKPTPKKKELQITIRELW